MIRFITSYFGSIILLSAVIFSPVFSGQVWADDSGLSREEIVRQHQHLMNQNKNENSDDGASASQTSSEGVNSQSKSSDLVVRLLGRVNALESQTRSMQGTIDQLSNKVTQDGEKTRKELSDMQFALQGNSTNGSSAPSQTKDSIQNESKTSSSSPSTSAAQSIKNGSIALKSHRYEEAESQAHDALKTAHSNWGKTEGRFLLSQALAGQKLYQKAALSYYDTYSKDPKSKRAPEALLGVSGAMLALNNKPAACEALQRLRHEYPDSPSHIKSSEKVFRARAACH